MLLSYGGMRELEGARAMHESHTARAIRELDERQPEVFNPGVAEIEADEISFDQHDDWVDTAPNFRTPAVGNRFNVLRPPQREAFRPPPPMPGPQGGNNMREVGRVGRFAILAEQESSSFDMRGSPENSREVRRITGTMTAAERGAEHRLAVQLRAREMSAKEREYRESVHETLPTAYDRLMNDDDLFEDDLE